MKVERLVPKRQTPVPQTNLASVLVDWLYHQAPDLYETVVTEHPWHPTRKWAFDLAWPDMHIAVEVDGGQWKPGGGKHGTVADYDKINQATLAGWRVLRFHGEQVKTDPPECIRQIVLLWESVHARNTR